MVSEKEKQALKGVRNFSGHLFDPRLGPSAEALLVILRGVALPKGKLAEQNADPRQRAAILRARADLGRIVNADWSVLNEDDKRTKLEAVLG